MCDLVVLEIFNMEFYRFIWIKPLHKNEHQVSVLEPSHLNLTSLEFA